MASQIICNSAICSTTSIIIIISSSSIIIIWRVDEEHDTSLDPSYLGTWSEMSHWAPVGFQQTGQTFVMGMWTSGSLFVGTGTILLTGFGLTEIRDHMYVST